MRVAGAACVLVVALAGCSSDEPGPGTLPALPSASAGQAVEAGRPLPPSNSAATPSPLVPPNESPASASGAPQPEVQPATAAGASAFTRHFFAQVNRAYTTSNPALVRRLSHSDCHSCRSIIEDIERLSKTGSRVLGQRFILAFAETAPFAEGEPVVVDFRFSSDEYVEVADDGSVGASYPATHHTDGQARLLREGSAWTMYGLRLVGT